MNQPITPVVGFISIHALREESDGSRCRHHDGRTISIHALREESDARAA